MEAGSAKIILAQAMRQLLTTTPFSKISVSRLCAECGLNRKSFYYHFKDKYDLICWIFEAESHRWITDHAAASDWDSLLEMLKYLDENRAFYAKVLRIEGQNSFRKYLAKSIVDTIQLYYNEQIDSRSDLEFLSHFLAGALLLTVLEWILDATPDSPQEFAAKLRRCVKNLHLVNRPLSSV